ncbi:DUF418 domain-containing protein [Halobacterium litoreum]|uniref:DUF418 domain-containing protein n=1 Tax=Halobacterium litoreum TaxID=2039234 RepID=A0ABD5NHE0_9EURY|nr:DUF418 domain-containing protein [Halobacterium litoreum]UHH12393.1 DUF418 domain-containing protein [Halobacterium litoreum]
MTDDAAPTPPSERIVGLDALRGFALLGILVINIRLFSMPEAVLLNPTVYGDFSGANYWAWFAGYVFAERKFLTLFTMLFGASVLLFTRKFDDQLTTLRLHYRRSLWLVVFGLAHAYLLWYGDILVSYGVTALFVVFARDESAKFLATVGAVLFVVPSLLELLTATSGDVSSFVPAWRPAESALQAEVATYRGGWLAQMDHRAASAWSRQTTSYLAATGWRTAGAMFVGMSLFKTGVLTNERSARFYRLLVAVGGVVGVATMVAGAAYVESSGWSPTAGLYWQQFIYFGAFPMAGAYIGAVMLLSRRRPGGRVTHGLAAIGRTAFSNYILQSVLATTIFYGHGLGLFGRVSRVEALGVVAAIWAFQIAVSVAWLRRYRYGPLEWLWRTLTYGERQPIRRTDR